MVKIKWLIIVLFIAIIVSFLDKPVIVNGDNVTISYSASSGNLTFNPSTVNFIVGAGQVITGLDVGVLGMRVGEVKNLTLPPRMAYGEYNYSKVYSVPYSFFEENNHSLPSLYEKVTLNGEEGLVINLTGSDVVIDTNSPLAGMVFNFTIKVLSVSK